MYLNQGFTCHTSRHRKPVVSGAQSPPNYTSSWQADNEGDVDIEDDEGDFFYGYGTSKTPTGLQTTTPKSPSLLEENRPDIAEALQRAAMTPRCASGIEPLDVRPLGRTCQA